MFDWFKIFNKSDFLATGLTSRTYTVNLEGYGQKDILVTMGNCLGITFEGVFMMLSDDFSNPFKWEGCAVYIDENLDVHLGIAIDEN